MPDERLAKIISDILEKRPDLTKDFVLNLIEEKKANVGSGYLSPFGAAYLVANDLGIDISRIEQRSYRLNELVSGLNNITIICNFLKSSKIRNFTRKDGTNSSYRKSLVFDEGIIVRLIEWDSNQRAREETFSPGEPIIIKGASTHTGRDGKIEIHVTPKCEISLDNSRATISLDSVTRDVSLINREENSLVVRGIVAGEFKHIFYKRKDGNEGSAIQFQVRSTLKPDIKKKVIVWSPADPFDQILSQDALIRLVDIDSRLAVNGVLELHGGEQTQVEVIKTEVKPTDKAQDHQFYIISIGTQSGDAGRRTALLSNSSNFVTLTLSGKLVDLFSQASVGDILEIDDYTIKDGQVYMPYSPSNIRIVGSDEQFLSTMIRKIKDISSTFEPIVIEVVALSKARERSLTTKAGRPMQITELLVGDETGEVEISAWGRLGGQLAGIMPGTRLKIYGALPARGADAVIRLQCKEYTKVTKITN